MSRVKTPPERLDAERERRHVEQHHVLDVALQHAGLDRGAERHHLVGVDALVRVLAEELGHFLDHLRHPGHAADQHHLVDVGLGDPGIFQRCLARLHGPRDQVAHQALELGARQLQHEVQRLVGLGIHRDERLVDLGLGARRKLDLGLLRGFLKPLQRHLVLGEVDAVLLLELAREVFDDAQVEVLAAEEGVAIGRLHLEEPLVDLQDRNVEGAAAEVVDRDGLGALLVEAVGQRRRGRLVDDPEHLQPGDLAGVLGGLALGVVEVGRHSDHRLADLLAEIALGGFLHLLQHEGGNLARGVLLALDLDPGVAVRAGDDLVGDHLLVLGDHRVVGAAADQPLDGEQRVLGIGHRLALGGLAHQSLLVGEGDDRGRRACALRILDHPCLAAIHDGDAGIGGAEVDPDDFRHADFLSGGDFTWRVRFRPPHVSLGRVLTAPCGSGVGRLYRIRVFCLQAVRRTARGLFWAGRDG